MSRPKKQTVDYFPHFVYDSKTLFTLENRFGNDGYASWFKLLELLCKSDGHFYDCSNVINWEYLIAYIKVDEDTASSIMIMLSEMNKIDIELWEHKIIWCQSLMDTLASVYTKRKVSAPKKPIVNSSKEEVEEVVVEDVAHAEPPVMVVVKPTKTKKKVELSTKQNELFNKFWEMWPNKVSKGQAEITWLKINPDNELFKAIIDGVKKAIENDKRFKEGFTPHASTWLNAKGWADEFSLSKSEHKSPKVSNQNDFEKHDYDFDKIERKAMENVLKENGGGTGCKPTK